MEIDPNALAPAERYKLLIGAIVPRPIAWVSTRSPGGALNVAPFSFFNGVSQNPYALLFCPSNKPDGTEKDTLCNIERTRAFVVNVASEAQARQMAITAEDLEHGESEFELAGLTPEPARVVAAPRVAGAPFCFECEPLEIVRLNPGAPGGGNVVIGRILWAHAADGVVDDRMRVNPARLAAIGRMAGLGYCTTRQRFEIPWGRDAIGAGDPIKGLNQPQPPSNSARS